MPVYDDDAPHHPLLPNRSSPWLWASAATSLVGGVFAAISTADFVEHLDRQVHSIHCSFLPGMGQQIGDSGCRVVMMSPYSSILRTQLWGGLPISLLALAVFAYLAYRGVDFALRPAIGRTETTFAIAAHGLPLLMSLVYGGISTFAIGALCKVCAGIYVVSILGFAAAVVAHRKVDPEDEDDDDAPRPKAASFGLWFGEGVAYVAVLVGLYLALAPVSAKSREGCGTLVKADDPNGILVPLGGRGAPALAVLDPLCPACAAFDARLAASGLDEALEMKALLFPLDDSCNWMVKGKLHPGACAVSEAILCEPAKGKEILAFAFARQAEIKAAAASDDAGARAILKQAFPSVAGCLGTAAAKNKVNKSLRYAVRNALPVLTPQLFVNGRRVCDEDTDLGLEYSLTALLEKKP